MPELSVTRNLDTRRLFAVYRARQAGSADDRSARMTLKSFEQMIQSMSDSALNQFLVQLNSEEFPGVPVMENPAVNQRVEAAAQVALEYAD